MRLKSTSLFLGIALAIFGFTVNVAFAQSNTGFSAHYVESPLGSMQLICWNIPVGGGIAKLNWHQ